MFVFSLPYFLFLFYFVQKEEEPATTREELLKAQPHARTLIPRSPRCLSSARIHIPRPSGRSFVFCCALLLSERKEKRPPPTATPCSPLLFFDLLNSPQGQSYKYYRSVVALFFSNFVSGSFSLSFFRSLFVH